MHLQVLKGYFVSWRQLANYDCKLQYRWPIPLSKLYRFGETKEKRYKCRTQSGYSLEYKGVAAVTCAGGADHSANCGCSCGILSKVFPNAESIQPRQSGASLSARERAINVQIAPSRPKEELFRAARPQNELRH